MSRDFSDAVGEVTSALDSCVHCGFCLPACPTYVRLGDEADSPRGRLHLMRAVAEGRIDASSNAFQLHLDRCLGCRACEPVCPSGVPYGSLLEHAREAARQARPPTGVTRAFLWAFDTSMRRRVLLGIGRGLRALGLTRLLVALLSSKGATAPMRRALLMLEGARPWSASRYGGVPRQDGGEAEVDGASGAAPEPAHSPPPVRTALLDGCVQSSLFARVNEATVAVLKVNGFRVVAAPGQGCCGAIHAHAGDMEGARRLARRNIAAFEAAAADRIGVNAAGCGAAMLEYGEWLRDDAEWQARAEALARRCADVTELLSDRGPRRGSPLVGAVAYHPPCHLEHARGVTRAPRDVLAAIPGLEVRTAERSTECCGGAGIYGVTHPDLGGRIGADKARSLAETGASCVATGNPGCMMQVAAFLHDEEGDFDVAHPVELLHESYRRAGLL